MKFIRLNGWSIRADKIVAVRLFQLKDQITVYSENDKEYSATFNNSSDAAIAYTNFLAELEKA